MKSCSLRKMMCCSRRCVTPLRRRCVACDLTLIPACISRVSFLPLRCPHEKFWLETYVRSRADRDSCTYPPRAALRLIGVWFVWVQSILMTHLRRRMMNVVGAVVSLKNCLEQREVVGARVLSLSGDELVVRPCMCIWRKYIAKDAPVNADA
ncbi:unnamed protein product [Ectocarpus sp. 6 AP-2014]